MQGASYQVLICAASSPPDGTPVVSEAVLCPSGLYPYLVDAYLIDASSASSVESVFQPFDFSEGAEFFQLGFGVVIFCFLLGVVGHVLLAPWWSRRGV